MEAILARTLEPDEICWISCAGEWMLAQAGPAQHVQLVDQTAIVVRLLTEPYESLTQIDPNQSVIPVHPPSE